MFWVLLCPRGDAALLRVPFLVGQTCQSFAISGYILTFIYLHTRMRHYLLHNFIHQHFCKLQGSCFPTHFPFGSREVVTVTVL